ncbi:uncharacterized protein BO97DRAFT_409609 [Aspergillus homomorphus CBS 101889]|uniref:GRHL1/CP2 C-terminal domain-containing protein n=1 Tax=Aspergillus homomorphus (strain CBS 101889) TaxID=1450537 RepID=A0A395HF30_ASPHC|nr:hypothetical protein BO97DRAFT_409609 [Aspergillus homomorphus CBS 101889]RAL06492.1 hypothetical protein BO97DRAFT_409609 [Aspergillus homomorphus CBS 101889]
MIRQRPQVSLSQRPAACFYIRFPNNDYYRAIYVKERTIVELQSQISRKAQINICRIFFQISAGRKRLANDELLRQIPDGQDIIAEFGDTMYIDRGIDVVLMFRS